MIALGVGGIGRDCFGVEAENFKISMNYPMNTSNDSETLGLELRERSSSWRGDCSINAPVYSP